MVKLGLNLVCLSNWNTIKLPWSRRHQLNRLGLACNSRPVYQASGQPDRVAGVLELSGALDITASWRHSSRCGRELAAQLYKPLREDSPSLLLTQILPPQTLRPPTLLIKARP